MDAAEYRAALARLGITRMTGPNGAEAFFHITDRMAQRWAAGGPPNHVADALRVYEAIGIDRVREILTGTDDTGTRA